jgi:hypothetical protein
MIFELQNLDTKNKFALKNHYEYFLFIGFHNNSFPKLKYIKTQILEKYGPINFPNNYKNSFISI